jgi:membrane protein involved in colicin uptake
LLNGAYQPVEGVDGRFFSEQLGLHLQSEGAFLRLYNPQTNQRLPTPQESRQESEVKSRQARVAAKLAQDAQLKAQEAQQLAVEAQQRAELETARLRQEIAELKKRLP